MRLIFFFVINLNDKIVIVLRRCLGEVVGCIVGKLQLILHIWNLLYNLLTFPVVGAPALDTKRIEEIKKKAYATSQGDTSKNEKKKIKLKKNIHQTVGQLLWSSFVRVSTGVFKGADSAGWERTKRFLKKWKKNSYSFIEYKINNYFY